MILLLAAGADMRSLFRPTAFRAVRSPVVPQEGDSVSMAPGWGCARVSREPVFDYDFRYAEIHLDTDPREDGVLAPGWYHSLAEAMIAAGVGYLLED